MAHGMEGDNGVTQTDNRKVPSPLGPEIRAAADREPTDKKAISSSVTKAFRIVEMLAGHASEGLSLGDLSTRLQMPKSTTTATWQRSSLWSWPSATEPIGSVSARA